MGLLAKLALVGALTFGIATGYFPDVDSLWTPEEVWSGDWEFFPSSNLALRITEEPFVDTVVSDWGWNFQRYYNQGTAYEVEARAMRGKATFDAFSSPRLSDGRNQVKIKERLYERFNGDVLTRRMYTTSDEITVGSSPRATKTRFWPFITAEETPNGSRTDSLPIDYINLTPLLWDVTYLVKGQDSIQIGNLDRQIKQYTRPRIRKQN